METTSQRPLLDQNENALEKGSLTRETTESSGLGRPRELSAGGADSTLEVSSSSSSSSEDYSEDDDSDDSCSVGSLDSAVEQLVLVSNNLKIFSELPADELTVFQQTLAELSACTMDCLVCGDSFLWLGEDDPSIQNHLASCPFPGTRPTTIRRSAYSSIKALAEALLAAEYRCEDDESSEDELSSEEDEEVEREVVERLVVICEPVDSVWEGRMGVVLSLPPRATLNDLDRAVKMDVLTCCEPVTAYMDRESVYQPLPRPLPPGSPAALVDLLADKPLRYRVGRQPGNQIYIRVSGLGVQRVLTTPEQGTKLLQCRRPQLVCCECEERSASYLILSQDGHPTTPVGRKVTPELVFLPPAICTTCHDKDEYRRSCRRWRLLAMARLRSLPCCCALPSNLHSTVEIDTTDSSIRPMDSQNDTTQTCSTCGLPSDQDDSDCHCEECSRSSADSNSSTVDVESSV